MSGGQQQRKTGDTEGATPMQYQTNWRARSDAAADTPNPLYVPGGVRFSSLSEDFGKFTARTELRITELEREKGPFGCAAPPGEKGPMGLAGSAAPPGPPGEKGPMGLAVPAGPPGEKGPMGLAGSAGPPGEKRPMGLAGSAAPPGPPGEKGPMGLAGSAAPPGPPGGKGPMGLAGSAGPPGEKGPMGLAGSAGPPGEKGPMRLAGSAGPPGEKGPIGLAGSAAPPGPPGGKGPMGLAGSAGPPGEKDPMGPAGTRSAGAPVQQVSRCSGNWPRFLVKSGICYKVFKMKKTFNEAAETCRQEGGTLAMPRNQQTNRFLSAAVRRRGIRRSVNVWFGLHDQREEGRFEWVDGTPLGDYNAWLPRQRGIPGQPDDYQGGEDCVAYFRSSGKPDKWNDASCSRGQPFICQYK
ncbi:pulmonary surfactant-associated protein D-like [Branchiostoma lanceolatum]|uniref:pulmonary surfactant-associated protein D-like n=1 Tax=Branchiostoma lanceolatum TaxID=7740 RepID=UPI003453922F